jgi:ABC-type glutathione transport system ATPase component
VPEAVLLRGEGLARRYSVGPGWRHGRRAPVVAVDGVSISIREQESVGLVGRSGAGKSTLLRLLLALEPASEGEIHMLGHRVAGLSSGELRGLRRQVQLVLQDPFSALDPRQRVRSLLAEGIRVHRLAPRSQLGGMVGGLLESVGLPTAGGFLHRLPAELSGGERQRVAIARALASRPRVLVLDEPVSALDASIRGQVVNLLLELHARLGLSLLVVSHDLWLVAQLCDRIVVMDSGRVVEEGAAASVLADPRHPATAALLSASAPGQGPARDRP